jgi:phytanoyl-CoA hydroxylase
MTVESDNQQAVRSFVERGFLVRRGLCPAADCAEMRAVTLEHLAHVRGPVEYEADVGYPGAPASKADEGGLTVRRLLAACSRDAAYRSWATGAPVAQQLRQLFGRDDIFMSQSHHNCIMTKHPGHSSATLWHQDIRYWSFDAPELISVWLALGSETQRNGALKVIPGSHLLNLDRGRFDSELFLRPDLAENQKLIEAAETVELEQGDALFFHCRLFHAAGMNLTDETKLSAVFTYHTGANQPIPHTRSAALPGIELETS